MYLKRVLLLLSMAVLLSALVVACAPAAPEEAAPAESDAAEETTGEEPAAPAEEEFTAERVTLDTVVSTEPPTLDPALGTDSMSIFFMRQMFVGLTGYDEQANVEPLLATDWDVSEDGLVWTYNLRDDIYWVRRDADSGEIEQLRPVVADDVVYGVQRTLDPNSASDYAFVLYLLEGGEDFNTADPAAENFDELRNLVGVEALDDTTVQFTLKEPAAYFPSITGMWVTFPMPREAIEEHGDQWTEPGNIVTNGAYTLQEWQHGSSIYIEKNPHWIEADSVQIEVFGGPIIQEAATAMALYENNEIDFMMDPPGWGPPLPDMDRIKADPQLSQDLFIAPQLCTYYYGFVNTKPPFDNVDVRKAFAMAIDRQSLIDNVTKGDQTPAHSFAPPGVFGNVANNFDIGGFLVEGTYEDRVAEAQTILAEAGYPDGEGIDILLMHNTSEAHAQIAQAVQAMWQEAFPSAQITIENQEWAVYLKTLIPEAEDADKPDVYRLGWCADYPDANNWLNEVFNSQSGQNYAKFNNEAFDALVEQAASEADPAVRQDLYRQAEEIFINDEMGIAPIYYYTYVRMYKPWLTKVVVSPVTGDPIAEWEMDWQMKQEARQ